MIFMASAAFPRIIVLASASKPVISNAFKPQARVLMEIQRSTLASGVGGSFILVDSTWKLMKLEAAGEKETSWATSDDADLWH